MSAPVMIATSEGTTSSFVTKRVTHTQSSNAEPISSSLDPSTPNSAMNDGVAAIRMPTRRTGRRRAHASATAVARRAAPSTDVRNLDR